MYKCENCGAELRFDPESQMLICDWCTARLSLSEYNEKNSEKTKTADERDLSKEEAAYYQNPEMPSSEDGHPTFTAHICTCPSCGGQLLTYEETAATFCSFCGATVLLESRVSDERRPDELIPFKITKEQAAEEYRKLLRRSFFAPREMKKEEEIERFRGIYMPYWVYSFGEEGRVDVRGRRSHRAGDFIVTDNFSFDTGIKAEFEGISFDASSSFADNLSEAIAPFDHNEAIDFDPGYISGFYADTNDVTSDIYFNEALSAAKEYTADVLMDANGFRSYNVDPNELAGRINLRAQQPKLAFFPVWFLSGRNKKGDRVSYAVVNGQNGKAAADLPVDKKKLLIGTLILAVPIFLFLNLVWTLTPKTLVAMTMALGIVALILASRQLNVVYSFEHRLDDKGYQAVFKDAPQKVKERKQLTAGKLGQILIICACIVCMIFSEYFLDGAFSFILIAVIIIAICRPKKKKNSSGQGKKIKVAKAPMKEKIKVLIKPIAGLIAAFIIFMADPVSDVYYYLVCMIAMLLIAWSFWDVLSMHNRLSTRPLPQFKKRGGESFEKY